MTIGGPGWPQGRPVGPVGTSPDSADEFSLPGTPLAAEDRRSGSRSCQDLLRRAVRGGGGRCGDADSGGGGETGGASADAPAPDAVYRLALPHTGNSTSSSSSGSLGDFFRRRRHLHGSTDSRSSRSSMEDGGRRGALAAPAVAAVAAGGGGEGAPESSEAVAASAAEAHTLQKHLVFRGPPAEAAFRLHVAETASPGELSLIGLQMTAWLAATGRTIALGSWACLARAWFLMLLPSIAHAALILSRPCLYRTHRELLSAALRVLPDLWLCYCSDVPGLGLHGSLLLHRGLPHSAKLLLIMCVQLVLDPLLTCQLFAAALPYSTALLFGWVCFHLQDPAASRLLLPPLLVAYGGPLVAIYRQELAQRTAFAAAAMRQAAGGQEPARADVRRLTAWVEGSLFGPAEFLLPAAIAAICGTCL